MSGLVATTPPIYQRRIYVFRRSKYSDKCKKRAQSPGVIELVSACQGETGPRTSNITALSVGIVVPDDSDKVCSPSAVGML
jgi:hypothetical protein